MNNLLPPLCLFLAIALLVAAFGLWAVEGPQAGIELHQARVEGDETYGGLLESQLKRRQFAHTALIACLFIGSGVMTMTAFLAMRPSSSP